LNDLYDALFEDVDEIAERIRQLDGKPVGTMKGYLELTEVSEYEGDTPEGKEIFKYLLLDYEFIIREIRNFLSTEELDNGTVNLLEDMIMKKEKGITCEYPCKIAMQMVTSALGHMDDYYLKTYFTSEP